MADTAAGQPAAPQQDHGLEQTAGLAVDYGPSTALLVVDVQNDFADPGGSLSVPAGRNIIPAINAEIVRARAAGATIVYTQDWHPPSTPHFAKDGGVWPVHCVGDSWGAALHPELVLSEGALFTRKGTGGEDGYSGFTMRDPAGEGEDTSTGLAEILHRRSIERVVIVGLATDYCVKETALDAIRLGYRAAVITSAVGAVDLQPGDGLRSLEAMQSAGVELR